jgi:hypothetical protein
MPYEGSKEFVSAQTSQYPGLLGLQMGQSSYNWAVTTGSRHRELQKLSALNMEAGNQVRTMVDALERVGYSPDLFVSKQGSVSMRLSGQVIHVPVFDQLRGTVTMGASEYAGAMQSRWTGSSMEKLNVMEAFIQRVRAHIPGEGVKIKGIDAIHDKGALPGVIAELSKTAREEWLQSIHTVTGDLQSTKAYFLGSRIQMDVTDIPALQNLSEEIQTIQRHLLTRRNMDIGGGRRLVYGPEMEVLLGEKVEAFKLQLQESMPGTSLSGLKPGAFMPHLRRTAGGKKTSGKVILSLLPGDALSSVDNYNDLAKGRYQMVLARVLHRDELGGDPITNGLRQVAAGRLGKRRIVPIVTEKGYFNQLKQYSAIRSHRLGQKVSIDALEDLTTKAPMTLAIMDPGQSTAAYSWLRKHVDDTGVLLGTKYARQVASKGSRNYQIKVNVNRFSAARDLPSFVKDLEYIEHKQLGNMRAADFGAIIQNNTIIDPHWTDRQAWKGQFVLGVETSPFGETRHMMDADDVLESVQRKGDELIFRLKRARASSGMGAGLNIDTRRVGVTGFSEALGRQGIDVAGGIGEFGLKFGKDAAFTHRLYTGHVFSRLERSNLKGARYEKVMETVANAMGAEYTWRGERALGTRQFQTYLPSSNVTGENSRKWMDLVRRASQGPSRRQRLARHDIVQRAMAVEGLSAAEQRTVREAFEIGRVGMSEVMGVSDPYEVRRMAKQGAYALKLEGAPVQIRDIEMPDKRATNWRLTEHNLWRARGAGLERQDARLFKAFQTLDQFLAPRISESGVASDTLRFLGQFATGMEEMESHLMAAVNYTPDDIAQMAVVPKAEGGKLMAEQLVGKETLISTMGADSANQQLAYRRGGFNVTLREGDQIAIGLSTSHSGKTYAKTTSRFFVPGMEMFGKYGRQPELFMEGGSRVIDNVVDRKLFGDYMNVVRALEEYSSGSGDLGPLQRRLNILYQGMGEKLLGKESLLKRYFTPDAARGLTGRTVVKDMLAGKGDELTIGITEEAFQHLPKTMRSQYNLGKGMGIITHYPTSDTAHQAVVKIKVLSKAQMLSGLTKEQIADVGRHNLHKVIASSPALHLMTQRDLDFDWSYLRFIDDEEGLTAARALYGEDLKRFGPVHDLLNALPKTAARDAGLAFDQFKWSYMGQHADGSYREMTNQRAMMEELSAIVRQQGKTPLAYSSFVKQRQIATWIGQGKTRDMVLDAIGGGETRAGRSIAQIGELLGDPANRQMMGEVWTATINSMLKKDSGRENITELLSTLGANAKQAVSSKHHRADLAEEFYNLFVGNSATQGMLAEMGLSDAQTGGKAMVSAATKEAAMTRYFNPLAEFMGHMQIVEDAVKGTHLKHALVSLTGFVGQYDRLQDLEGVMGQLAQLQGVTTPRLAAGMLEDPFAMREVLADVDHLRVQEAMETVAKTGLPESVSQGAKNLAGDGLLMLKEIWRRPWGKVGMIAGGAAVASELFGGVFSGDPDPVMPGAGAPLPPRPAFDQLAQRQHVDYGVIPTARPRIHTPYHMRTNASATAYAPVNPMSMRGGGHYSPLPTDSDVVYAGSYQPEATRWGMANYMSRRMASSF